MNKGLIKRVVATVYIIFVLFIIHMQKTAYLL